MSISTSSLPKDLYSVSQVQEFEKLACKIRGITSFELMKSAGLAALLLIKKAWPDVRNILILSGSGNNGGDGYVIAGLAKREGVQVRVLQLCSSRELKGDAKLGYEFALSEDVSMHAFTDLSDFQKSVGTDTVIVDALLGTGICRNVSGDYREAIKGINSASCPVFALDVPSGLNADTGMPMKEAVAADVTITFIGVKQGLLTGEGRDYCGQIFFEKLDLPDSIFDSSLSLSPSLQRIDINFAISHLSPRKISSNKKHHGHVVVVGGDYGFGGAAILTGEAALRSGSGLVTLLTRSEHRSAALARRPELMILGTEDKDADPESVLAGATVIVIGPGLGRSDWANNLLRLVLRLNVTSLIPLVVDADALNLLSEKLDVKGRVRRNNWILTPHPGEAARLLGWSIEEVQNDRFAALKEVSTNWGGACLLKGSGSLTCNSDVSHSMCLCSEGNPGMASAGMGDVLTGIVASLLGQGFSLFDALNCGICIHGKAGDLAKKSGGERGLLASDLFPYLRELVNPV